VGKAGVALAFQTKKPAVNNVATVRTLETLAMPQFATGRAVKDIKDYIAGSM
jgi:hypothetical protein